MKEDYICERRSRIPIHGKSLTTQRMCTEIKSQIHWTIQYTTGLWKQFVQIGSTSWTKTARSTFSISRKPPKDTCPKRWSTLSGHETNQIASIGNSKEWAVDKIETHHGRGTNAIFKLIWKAGDSAWLPYHEIPNLEVLNQYLEAIGTSSIEKLPKRISQEDDLPLGSVAMRLDQLASEIVDDADYFRRNGKMPKNGRNQHSKKYKKGSSDNENAPRSSTCKMSKPNKIALYRNYALLLDTGTFDHQSHFEGWGLDARRYEDREWDQ